MDETLKSELIERVVALAQAARSDIHLGSKYGGTVFMTDADQPSSLVGGVYGSAKHVSVEFSNGAGFTDATGLLEGKGKARRHVKLTTLGDLEAKDVAGFLAQALA